MFSEYLSKCCLCHPLCYVYPGWHLLWELQPVSQTRTYFPEACLTIINQVVQIACFALKWASANVCVISCYVPQLSQKQWHDLRHFLVAQAAEASHMLWKASLMEQHPLPEPSTSVMLQSRNAFASEMKSPDCYGDSGYSMCAHLIEQRHLSDASCHCLPLIALKWQTDAG